MCALFTLKTTYTELQDSLGLPIDSHVVYKEIDERFLPHQLAPVVRSVQEGLSLEKMSFSLIPSWSKERRPKFATHNARLETLKEKPTWKRPLIKHHALVPISEFIEPIYEGPYGGHMVGFSQTQNKIIWAAGLWDEWVDPATGEIVPSFTIITHDPGAYVRKIGHDREPLFLSKESFSSWLIEPNSDPGYWIDFLKNAYQEPTLKAREDRKLKSHK